MQGVRGDELEIRNSSAHEIFVGVKIVNTGTFDGNVDS